jgi:hypothetical protein
LAVLALIGLAVMGIIEIRAVHLGGLETSGDCCRQATVTRCLHHVEPL